jgi:putative NADH-flavin reductase
VKILLLGATGRTGQCIIEEALKKGHQISAIARDIREVVNLTDKPVASS